MEPTIPTMLSAGTPKHEGADLSDALETLPDCLKRMESILMGMRQIRRYVAMGLGHEILESLIEEAETQIAEVKRRVIQ